MYYVFDSKFWLYYLNRTTSEIPMMFFKYTRWRTAHIGSGRVRGGTENNLFFIVIFVFIFLIISFQIMKRRASKQKSLTITINKHVLFFITRRLTKMCCLLISTARGKLFPFALPTKHAIDYCVYVKIETNLTNSIFSNRII